MEDNHQSGIEKALARTEAGVETTLKIAGSVVNSLRRFRSTIQSGNLRDLKKTMDSAEQAVAAWASNCKHNLGKP